MVEMKSRGLYIQYRFKLYCVEELTKIEPVLQKIAADFFAGELVPEAVLPGLASIEEVEVEEEQNGVRTLWGHAQRAARAHGVSRRGGHRQSQRPLWRSPRTCKQAQLIRRKW